MKLHLLYLNLNLLDLNLNMRLTWNPMYLKMEKIKIQIQNWLHWQIQATASSSSDDSSDDDSFDDPEADLEKEELIISVLLADKKAKRSMLAHLTATADVFIHHPPLVPSLT